MYSNTAQCFLNKKLSKQAEENIKNALEFFKKTEELLKEKENSDYNPEKYESGDYLHATPLPEMDKIMTKINFRFGQTFYLQKDYRKALEYFKKSGDKEKIIQCQKKVKSFTNKEAQLFQNMFSNYEVEIENERKREKAKQSLEKMK